MSEENKVLKNGSQLFDTNYIIDKNLGGGMDGVVYVIHNKDYPNQKLAAKVFNKPEKMDDEYWTKRGNEILTSKRISHRKNPNLASTYDAFVTKDNTIVLIMDYVNGVKLSTYLEKQGCLSPKIALNIFKKILNGIKQLHSYKQKIIHRDLKPDNIMISHDLSKVVIIDFSVSSVLKGEDSRVITDFSKLYGTSSYILPDLLIQYRQTKQVKNVSVQSDFFSLGVILYEMIMGTLPFEPITKMEKGERVVDIDRTIMLPRTYDIINISSNPTIPTSLENIIFRCLASKNTDLKYRYNNVDEIIDDVNKCLLILDKKTDTTPLLKPVKERLYQQASQMDPEIMRSQQKWYKQWWSLALFFGLGLTTIIVAIIWFFVI